MELSPVARYAAPRYPARDVLDVHPELLRVLPNRWRRNAAVGVALAAACGIVAAGWQGTAALAAGGTAKVAPVFQHGQGAGHFGGISTGNVAFLSEDDARQTIIDEARRAGLSFTPGGRTIEKLALPVTRLYPFGDAAKKPKTRQGLLALDGVDAKRNIAFEYVSQDDFFTWRAADDSMNSTASSVNLLDTAKTLRTGLAAAKPAGAVAVFYDPVVYDPVLPQKKATPFTEQTLAPLPLFETWPTFVKDLKINSMLGYGSISFFWQKKSISLTVGSTEALVNGKKSTLPCPVVVRNNTPYLPLKWTAEALGGTVTWDAKNKQVKVLPPQSKYAWSSAVEEVLLEGRKAPGSAAFTYYDREGEAIRVQSASREELRKQVRDFIAWLKAEGVI
ncbi:MAG: copper amine oxidase N-terminal domain-containing protein [Armatimonadota bacterium]